MSFTPTPRKKIALDNSKLSLYGPSTAEGKLANLNWMLVKNNPRLVVWTNDPADQTERNGNGKIQAELDAPVLMSLLEKMKSLVNEAPNTRFKLENKNFTFFGGKRSDEPVITSEIWVGKDKEGFVYISVTAPNRPVIKFRIMPSNYHTWYNQSGEKISPEELNKIYVSGYINILQDIYSNLLVTEYVDVQAEKAAKTSNQKSYGGQQQGSGNSYSQQKQQSQSNSFADEDAFPF